MEKDAARVHVQRTFRDRHPNNSTGHCQALGDKQKEHTSDSPSHLGQTIFPALQGSAGAEANPSHNLNTRKRRETGKSRRSAVPHGWAHPNCHPCQGSTGTARSQGVNPSSPTKQGSCPCVTPFQAACSASGTRVICASSSLLPDRTEGRREALSPPWSRAWLRTRCTISATGRDWRTRVPVLLLRLFLNSRVGIVGIGGHRHNSGGGSATSLEGQRWA